MRYICTKCNYIYDESIGDEEESIVSGTIFDELGDYFTCPVCSEPKEVFHEIKEEVNYIDDNTSDFLELEHFLDLHIKENLLSVRVGKYELHSSLEEHRITEITLYDEYKDIVETKFIKMFEDPETQFDISDIDDFEVRVRCNIHGVWGKKFIRN